LTLANLVGSFRRSDWVLIGYFVYVACLPPFFPDRPHLHFQPFLIAVGVFTLLLLLAYGEQTRWATAVGMLRDWIPILLTLVAFQEMEIFLPRRFDHQLESAWIRQDILLLGQWHLRALIESLGVVLPYYL
jgi:hypothetical protein